MKHRSILAALLALVAAALVGAQPSFAKGGHGHGNGKGEAKGNSPSHSSHHGRGNGVVFVQTNQPSGNQIVVFRRGPDGRLNATGTYPTGGLGGVASPGAESDTLASQGSLQYVPWARALITVNAGSDTISTFRVNGHRLRLLNVVSSGGQFPNSVAVHGRLVYVLNAGGTGIVHGFWLTKHHGLAPIGGSARSLGLANGNPPNFLTAPGQAGFTPDGRQLLVTTKASTSSIDAFLVGEDGVLSAAPVVNPSATPVPFAFTFGGGRLVDGEAGTSSVTTYAIDAGGVLSDPRSASDGQMALCWILGVNGVYYVSNTASNNLSSFTIDPAGQPSLLEAVAATTNPGPIDLASSGDFLYAETGSNGTVDEFAVNGDGTLDPIGMVTGLPAGIEGIAAK